MSFKPHFTNRRYETEMEDIAGHAVLPIQSMADKQGAPDELETPQLSSAKISASDKTSYLTTIAKTRSSGSITLKKPRPINLGFFMPPINA